MKTGIKKTVTCPGRASRAGCFLVLFLLAGWLATSAQAGVVFTNLYSFPTGPNRAGNPVAGLVQGNDGYLYGTSQSGNGTVFQISTNGVLTNLYSFSYPGTGPNGLVQGSDGYLYGTTLGGGNYGAGSVFKVSTSGTLTNLVSFRGGQSADGGPLYPGTALVQGSDGVLYGTSSGFQEGCCHEYEFYGGVFLINTNGMYLGDSFLYLESPSALVQGSDGYLYGTTYGGGSSNNGTVFTLGGVFYSFTGTNDGANPVGALVQGTDGCLYGVTAFGGSKGYGTVFQFTTNGVLTSLYSFTSVVSHNCLSFF
jgi:uncharacterized repeat protein (TIGR03803 family)